MLVISKTNDTDAQINSMRHTLYDQISIFCFFRRDLSSFHKAINCIFYILNEKSDTIVKKRETYDVVSVQITLKKQPPKILTLCSISKAQKMYKGLKIMRTFSQ